VWLKFTDKNFKQPNCFWLSMHAYRILLPSETYDNRFNSREKHHAHRLSTRRVFGLYCEISDLCFLHGPRSLVARPILKNLGLIFHTHALSISRWYVVTFTDQIIFIDELLAIRPITAASFVTVCVQCFVVLYSYKIPPTNLSDKQHAGVLTQRHIWFVPKVW
jgi:hypothetical protein